MDGKTPKLKYITEEIAAVIRTLKHQYDRLLVESCKHQHILEAKLDINQVTSLSKLLSTNCSLPYIAHSTVRVSIAFVCVCVVCA